MSTIFELKEQAAVTLQPVLLAELQFIDGSMLYLSTHPLSAAEGGYPYSGHNYLARIQRQDIAQIQARSESGIDRVPSITLHLEDSDKTLYNNYERAGVGFKGALLTCRIVFWDADTTTFSSNSGMPFVGVCDGPQFSRSGRGDVLEVAATSAHNMARTYLPVFHVQQRCGNLFPRTAGERLAGATDMSSPWWGCGYNPDQAGTDPEIGGDCRRGNAGFTDCNYTKEDCSARGMYRKDSSNRWTGRFTGNTFTPAERETRSRSYDNGKWVTVLNARLDAAYQESYPMVYGTQWVKPVVLSSLGDGNSTRGEAVICQDDIGNYGILQLVINGAIIARNGSSPDNAILRWNFCGDPALGTPLHTGTRNGVATRDALFDERGDPHGSLAAIEWVVYRQVAESGNAPNMMALTSGPAIKIATSADPTAQGSWTKAKTTNPVWVLLDCLIWSNWRYAEIDLQTFIDEAPYCDASVSYRDLTGGTSSHARYKAQFGLEKRRTAGEISNALLRSFNAQLTRDPATGKIQLLIRKTLADQQPGPVSGSNYNSAVSSKTAAGFGASGYAAYHFDESTVARQNPDDPPFLRLYQEPIAQTPNKVSVAFQDEDNSYATDSISIVDADAINRAGGYQGGQEVAEQFNAIGFSNFDQASRVLRTYLAERLRGNPAGDTRGTIYFEIQTNFRAMHLRTGHLCLLSWQAYGISRQAVRVISVRPGTNWETATITLAWHNDDWYTDAWGQQAAPINSDPRRTRPNRRAYPWKPYGEQPIENDSVYGSVFGFADRSWWGFGVAQAYEILEDGTALAKVSIYGCPPVNDMGTAQPPIMGIQGGTTPGGGSIPGGWTIYMAIAAVDADGKLSPLSKLSTAFTGVSTDSNTVTTPPISWMDGAVGYVLYAGRDEYTLSEQDRGSGLPGTLTVRDLNYATYGPPDVLAAALNFCAKRVIHGGTFGTNIGPVATDTIKFSPPTSLSADQFAGYDLMLVARAQGVTDRVPIACFRVVGNDVDGNFVLTPDPDAAGIVEGDVFICLTKPSSITDFTITDTNFRNPWAPDGLTPGAEAGNLLRIMAGKGMGQVRTITDNTADTLTISEKWSITPDDTSRFIIEEASWQYDLDTERIVANDPAPDPAPLVGKLNVDNYAGQTILIQPNVVDGDGNWSYEPFAQLRMLYIWGNGGTIDSDIWTLSGKVTY